MCGIVGFVNYKQDISNYKNILSNMNNALSRHVLNEGGYYIKKRTGYIFTPKKNRSIFYKFQWKNL